MRRLRLGLLPALILAGCGAPQACRVEKLADLPLLAGRRIPAVEASLDGQKVALFIDTGAALSIITRSAADRFGLSGGAGDAGNVMVRGIGGTVFAQMATIHRLGLGHGMAREISMPVAGELGGPVDGLPVLGLFGADFLSNYDVDIDVPGHHFAMYSLRGCGPAIQPVDAPYFEVPFHLDATKVEFDLKLNGQPVRGFLDTGATRTLITPDDARRAGVTGQALLQDRAGHAVGIDSSPLQMRMHRFGSLEIGAERMNNFPFVVADADIDEMILGDDFLHFNRVWISYPLQRLFIQPAMHDPLVHQAQ